MNKFVFFGLLILILLLNLYDRCFQFFFIMVHDSKLYYVISYGNEITSDALTDAIVNELKYFVFDSDSNENILRFDSSNVNPLRGSISLNSRDEDICKVLDIFFRLSRQFQSVVFRIATEDHEQNPFYKECLLNEVIPAWCKQASQLTTNLFGCGGVLHLVSPNLFEEYHKLTPENIVRLHGSRTRNVILTESVQRKLYLASTRNYGMQNVPVSLPESYAYIAKERPDILSRAIREYLSHTNDSVSTNSHIKNDKCFMVNTWLCQRDYKMVTEVASIDAPQDIVSYRITNALEEFDKKYGSQPTVRSENVIDDNAFEKERFDYLYKCIFETRPSNDVSYVNATSLVGPRHRAECRRLFIDGVSSTAEDESDTEEIQRLKKTVYKKRRNLGKKAVLTPVIQGKSTAPTVPQELLEDEFAPNPPSCYLKSFERAVNGEERYYKQSSDDDSLGEDEDIDLFGGRSKKQMFKLTKRGTNPGQMPLAKQDDDNDDFNIHELIHNAPPLVESLTIEDFDDL